MRQNQDRYHLEGMDEHLVAINKYTPSTKKEFLTDIKVQDAILMRLMSLGEEAGHLSEQFKLTHASIRWHQIIGLRNRLAHGYFAIDPEVVWELLTDNSLKKLEQLLKSVLDQEEES